MPQLMPLYWLFYFFVFVILIFMAIWVYSMYSFLDKNKYCGGVYSFKLWYW